MIQLDPWGGSFLFIRFRIRWGRNVCWVFYNTWSTWRDGLLINYILNNLRLWRKNFLRYFLTNFLRTRIRSFINNNINSFHHLLSSFVVNSISLACGGVSQKYYFITLGVKLSDILSILKDETNTSKDSEILHIWLSSIPQFIGSLLCISLKYTLLTVWHAVLTTSPHKFLATSLFCNMALAIS